MDMRRRNLLGVGVAVVGASVGGCLDAIGGDDAPSADGDDGSQTGGDDDGSGDTAYETLSVGGQSVPLVPTADAHAWFAEDAARFVDARSREEYDHVRIDGAVHSPAADGLPEDDPTEAWPADERVVTYCVCPHSLAGRRAASLLDDGFAAVYALDEGLQEWIDRGHPTAGEGADASLPTHVVRGRTASTHAGEDVWVREPRTGQRELGTVAADGTFELTLRFVNVTDETHLVLETPAYELETTLAELTSDVVTGPQGSSSLVDRGPGGLDD